MQFFVRRADYTSALRRLAHDASGVEVFVRESYSPWSEVSRAGQNQIAELLPSSRALCAIDQVNGRLSSAGAFRTQHLLGLRGWATLKGELSQGGKAQAVLYDRDTRSPLYFLNLERHARNDVALHLGSSNYEQAGIEGKGHILGVKPGIYGLAILQQVTPMHNSKTVESAEAGNSSQELSSRNVQIPVEERKVITEGDACLTTLQIEVP